MERKERFTTHEKSKFCLDGESPDIGITRRDFGRQLLLAIAGTAVGCSSTDTKEKSTTPKPPPLRIEEDQRKKKLVKRNRMIMQCGPKAEIDEIEKNRCEANIKRTRKRHLACIECSYQEETLE